MTRKLVLLLIGVVAVVGVTAGVAAPGAGEDDDQPLSGSTLDQASAAALKHTGGGTVVDSEVGDDGAAYGVEIRLANGRQVEVSLDRNFNVVGQENDDASSEGSHGEAGSSDD
jgi:uncharacterized membrane protein YkoI